MSETINYMNLSRQTQKHKDSIMREIEKVIDDTAFSGGKYMKEFESRFASYIGTKFCSAVNSGTSALHLAYLALGIGEGDEVIVPADTFIASAWPTLYIGAKPVFCDIDPETWEINADDFESRITEKTKAVVMVHLYGQVGDVEKVLKIAKEHGLYVIEDCAQSHGAKFNGRNVGTFGDIACFSFYPGKNLGAFGEAGAINTNNEDLYKIIEMMKNHGSEKQYHHDCIGFNMRMDGIQAAVLSYKLNLLEEFNEKRREIACRYRKEINNTRIKMQFVDERCYPVYHLFETEVDDRVRFIDYMKVNNVMCGCHYPIPCHLQAVFSDLGYKKGNLPNSEYHAEHCVSLPMFPELTDYEIDTVIKLCNEYK